MHTLITKGFVVSKRKQRDLKKVNTRSSDVMSNRELLREDLGNDGGVRDRDCADMPQPGLSHV